MNQGKIKTNDNVPARPGYSCWFAGLLLSLAAISCSGGLVLRCRIVSHHQGFDVGGEPGTQNLLPSENSSLQPLLAASAG